jgi:hypothetical protein
MDVVMAFLRRRREILVPLGLFALALALYLPYVLKAGWYYDDWQLGSIFKLAGSSWSSQFHACTAYVAGGREASCLYVVPEWHLFGDHRHAFALFSLLLLFAMAWMVYLILCRCRLPWAWAALAAGLLVLFPADDSTRLWAAASYGEYVIALELAAVLLALRALRLDSGRLRWVLHGLSLLLIALAMATYEIVLPLVALNGFVYWAAYRDRRAIRRGLIDLGFAFAFVIYRLAINPPGASEGIVEHRSIGDNVSRGKALIEAAWKTWHATFVPGKVATIAIVAFLVIALVLTIIDAETRRRLRYWLAFLVASTVVALAGTFVFQTANSFYLPQTGSTFNRVVLPGSIAYVCLFVALLGIAFELVRRYVSRAWAAPAVVIVIVLLSGWHQLRMSSTHKEHWEASWIEQEKALVGFEAAVRGLPAHSRIVGFGVPNYEPEFVPIFAAPWDLDGALEYTTRLSPSSVIPMTATSTMPCRTHAVAPEGVEALPYDLPRKPLYFIDAVSGTAIHIDSRADCLRAIGQFGIPAFFAGEEATG